MGPPSYYSGLLYYPSWAVDCGLYSMFGEGIIGHIGWRWNNQFALVTGIFYCCLRACALDLTTCSFSRYA